MDLSRRDFFNLSAGASTATALGRIAGLGLRLAPSGSFYTENGRFVAGTV